MKANKLQEWALAAEIVGGIAVVISLCIVAYQINQGTNEAALNRNAIEVTAYQSLIKSVMELNAVAITQPEMAAIDIKARRSPNELADLERYRLNNFYTNILRHGDTAYFQYKRGIIDEREMESVLAIVVGYSNHLFATDRWEAIRDSFDSDYVEYLNERIYPPGT